MFLHGYDSCKESFNYQIEYFSKFFRVIAIDITGFGKSKSLPYAYSVDDYLNDILGVLTALEVDGFNLVAHSFGGRIAIKLASSTDKVKKLVLTGSAGLKPKRSLKYYFKLYYYKIIKRFLSPEKKGEFGSLEYRALTGVKKQSYYKVVNEYLDGHLKDVLIKTLIIFGENDRETPVYLAKKLNKNIKNSSLYVLKNSSHFCFLEKPTEFNVIVNEFLKG